MNAEPNTSTEDRMADKRLNLRAPLIIQKVHLDSERPVFFGYSKNISCSGIFVATTNPIEPGMRLDLEIPLPHSPKDKVRCSCEVVWKRPYGKHLPFEPGIGLKFLNMPAEISQAIDTWVNGKC